MRIPAFVSERAYVASTFLFGGYSYLHESAMEEPKTKSVLVTYLERNKVLKIPESNESGELKFLTEEFRKQFKFASNVSLVITFQRYDNDWGEYVELDDECTLLHKDKLKAVVTPVLTTPSGSTELSEVNS